MGGCTHITQPEPSPRREPKTEADSMTSIFSQEFSPQALVPSYTHPDAQARFAPLHFGQRAMTELCEGYYRIDLLDGTTHHVEAASALEALRMAQSMGEVRKVQREIFNRRRMVRELSTSEAEADRANDGALKPGTVLLSFESLLRWQAAKEAGRGVSSEAPMQFAELQPDAPMPMAAIEAPAFVAMPTEAPLAEVMDAPEAEATPASAAEVAAGILGVLRQGGEPEGNA